MQGFNVFALFFCLCIAFCGAEEHKTAEINGKSCIGCPVPMNPNKPRYREIAREALNVYLQSIGEHHLHQVVQVEKVTEQIVAGTITRINFSAIPTLCSNKNTVQTINRPQLLLCRAEHFALLSAGFSAEEYNENDEICSEEYTDDSNENSVGGLTEQDPTDPIYEKLAEKSLHKYANDIGSKQDYKVLQITKVTTQVVAGILTRINFDAAPTYCQILKVLSSKKPLAPSCGDLDLSKIISCYSEIWEQVWLDKMEVKVSCHSNF